MITNHYQLRILLLNDTSTKRGEGVFVTATRHWHIQDDVANAETANYTIP